MSQENVEIVQRLYLAAGRRDADAVLDLYDPEVELATTRIFLGETGGIYHGHDGLRRFFRDWHDAWTDTPYDFDELIDAGDQVISIVTQTGRGRASGVEVDLPMALVWTLRNGKILRVVWFRTRSEALVAAGLSE